MSYKSVLPLRLVWLGAGLMAMVSLYIAFSGYGVPGGTQANSVEPSVAILSKPVTSTMLSSLPSGTGSAGAASKLIEITSSSPVLNYAEDSRQLTEVKTTDSAAVSEDSSTSTTAASASATAGSENKNTEMSPVTTQVSGGSSNDVHSVSPTQPSSTDQTSPIASSTTTTTTTTSATVVRSDGGASKSGDDN
ncbi:MAG: hypothetical protein M0Z96_04840 [Actinomycetota bacterium]|nr:hypothetical protein [Actinomycetota bacterium]